MEELGNQDSDLEDLPPLDDMPFSLDDEPLDLGDIDLEDEGASAGGGFDGDFSDSEGAAELDLDMSDMGDLSAEMEADGDFSVLEDPDASEIDATDLDASDVAAAPSMLDGDMLEDDAEAGSEGVPASFFDEDEDETVALSEDELEDILGNTEEGFFEDFGEGEGDGAGAAVSADDDALEMRSDDDLVPDVDLEPIAPSSDTGAAFEDDSSLELPADEELGFDDFHDSDDAPAVSADAMDDAASDEFSAGILEGDDDEPIALSEDELDNIMGDVSPGSGEMLEAPGPADDAFDDFESVGDLDGDDASAFDGVPGDEEDENITLSDDELSQVLLDADGDEAGAAVDFDGEEALVVMEGEEPEFSADESSFDDDDVPETPSLSTLDMEDDEPIALTPEELGNIVSEVEGDEVVESDGMQLGEDDYAMAGVDDDDFADTGADFGDDFGDADGDAFASGEDDFSMADDGFAGDDDVYSADSLGGDDDGDVALSDSELGSILDDTDTDSVTTAEGIAPPDDFDTDFDDFGDSGDVDEAAAVAGVVPSDDEFADGKVIVLDEYEDQGGHEPVVEGPPDVEEPAAVAETGLAARAERIADEENLNREELRTMISYLDGLFDQLPEDTVREFSRSQYFDLYKKIMGELGL